MATIPSGSFPDPVSYFEAGDRLRIAVADEEAFADWWKRCMDEDFGLSPDVFADVLSSGMTYDVALEIYGFDRIGTADRFRVELVGRDAGMAVFLAGHSVSVDASAIGRIEIELVDVVPHRQGQGISAMVMRNARDLADRMGIRRLCVEAYVTGGPYAWLSYGFIPVAEAWDHIRDRISHQLAILSAQLPVDVLERVGLILGATSPRYLAALLHERTPVVSRGLDGAVRSVPLAKALMADSGQRWHGVLDLDDHLCLELLEACIERNLP